MSKKPNISKEAQVLLKLLRIALGTEPRKYFGEVVEPFPEGIDWREVVRLSYEHKVSAIAVDGLEASKYDPYKGLDEKQTEELKAVLVPWIKDVENTEWSYCYYVEVLKTLCQIFRDNGLTPIILKGYGLSLNYPRPSHRGSGDIDVFLVDEDGRPAAEEGNRIAKEVLGVEVLKEEDEHHSQFTFKGISVENHYELMGTSWGRKEDAWLKDRLKQIITKDMRYENDFLLPSPTFMVVFLTHHTFTHFYHKAVSLRQFCDYVLLIRRYYDTIDWSVVKETLEQAKLLEFAEGINGIAIDYFGLNSSYLAGINENKQMADLLFSDVMNIQQVPCDGIRVFGHYYGNRWHYGYFKRKKWGLLIVQHIHSFICDHIGVNPKNDTLITRVTEVTE